MKVSPISSLVRQSSIGSSVFLSQLLQHQGQLMKIKQSLQYPILMPPNQATYEMSDIEIDYHGCEVILLIKIDKICMIY
jgi:hypothetical protein